MKTDRSPLLPKDSSCVSTLIKNTPAGLTAAKTGVSSCAITQTVYGCVATGESGSSMFSVAGLTAALPGLAYAGGIGLGVAACTFFACKVAKKHIENSDLAATPSAPAPVVGMTK